jgi:hypothetical protein
MSDGATQDTHREGGSPPVEDGNWKLVYSRSYWLESPPEFALRWIVDRGIGSLRPALPSRLTSTVKAEGSRSTELIVDSGTGMTRFSTWDLTDKSKIVITKKVEKNSRTLAMSRETYRFEIVNSKTRLEIVVYRRPVSMTARLGFTMFSGSAGRPVERERQLVADIDRSFLETRR